MVIVVPLTEIMPIFTIPKEEYTLLLFMETWSKESPGEKSIGLPPSLHSIFASISSVVEHSNSVPVFGSKVNFFPAKHVKS